jgi:hypothetical protein
MALDEPPPDASAHVLVRVWLPDRPGALGLVASRIGAARGDIMGIDVLEQSDRIVVDEFAVNLPDIELVPMLVREIEEVDGASVEEVRIVGNFPDPRLDALESASRLCEASSPVALRTMLVNDTRDEFLADWAALVRGEDVLASVGDGVPSAAALSALSAGTTASAHVSAGRSGPDDLAVAALPAMRATLLLGRSGHPFRRRERAQLLALARIADRASQLLDASLTTG